MKRYRRATFSLITRYEVLLGLKARKATKLLTQFEAICKNHTILPLTDPMIVLASDLWASLKIAGQLLEDDDIFIAATALHHGLSLATGNTAHFNRIPGLTLEDWTQP